ncbi:laminin subunit alpha-like isoform X2 [Ptychodera flava]|uniref:laminin subunit alpha-like isoform X2 n=1 Tax=Ptychodera flava TaxID=63121 RepID=UPI003969BD40
MAAMFFSVKRRTAAVAASSDGVTVVCLLLLLFLPVSRQEAVNVALNKPILALGTCGSPAEMYFSHSQASKQPADRIDEYCDAQNPALAHPPRYMVDDNVNTWWQSASRMRLIDSGIVRPDSVITLELQQDYYIESISITMGDSKRPGQLGVFKSNDGKTFSQWMYVVSASTECQDEFGVDPNLNVIDFNSIICKTYTSVTARTEEVISFNLPVSASLKEWTKAKYVEFRFFNMPTSFGFLSDSYHHYTVTEITVMAECICNGHASACTLQPLPGDPSRSAYQCVCEGNTQGLACQECQHFYNQLPYESGENGFQCESCNCFDHSESCYYDALVAMLNQSLNADNVYAGGGVCIDCRNNTAGYNCEKCREFYYRPIDKVQTDEDACQSCDCFLPGTREDLNIGLLRGHCVMNNETQRPAGMMPGDCFCKVNVQGNKCDECKDGFYDLSATHVSGCLDCNCVIAGTVDNTTVCNKTRGQCPCKTYVSARDCGQCVDGYYGMTVANPDGCEPCGCNVGGSVDETCSPSTGECTCWNNIIGRQCDSVEVESYFPDVHFINAEFESMNDPQWFADSDTYPGFFWYGYLALSEGDSSSVTLTIPSGTRFSGQYQLLVRYISDVATGISVSLTKNSGTSLTTASASTTLLQCSDSWCYQNLDNDATSTDVFNLDSGDWRATATVGTTTGQVLLDRIVALPMEFLSPENLLGTDTTTQFDVDCDVRNNEMNSTGNIDFCLDQVFILTSYYLQGALSCDCDLTGSYNNYCDLYGGQCSCKPGVGGKRCDECLPSYYAYSSLGCIPCNCYNDNKVCNVLTGQCDCPDNTVGRQCDRCVTFTYGLNSTTGCQPCDCDPMGSSNMQCDSITGQCLCQPGVGDDDGKCMECQDGFKHFTILGCEACNCDGAGSLSSVCNKTNGQCDCKENVEGLQCDGCAAGTFYNSENNPTGCLECICMGITDLCSSSTLKNVEYSLPTDESSRLDWQIAGDSSGNIPVDVNASVSTIEGSSYLSQSLLGTTDSYWLPLTTLTGNLLGSYGSSLTFSLHFESDVAGTVTEQPTVYVEGRGNRYMHVLTPLENNQTKMFSIVMAEWDWRAEGTNQNITRSEFLKTLTDVSKFLFPANLFSAEHTSSIGEISYFKATGRGIDYDPMADDAYAVESCICGPEYTGSSCEECAPGYYRQNQTDHEFFGVCVPCECNGHSAECDVNTGQCLNCLHSTTGFNCELCSDGYYGDATQGTAEDCQECPCSPPKSMTTLCSEIEGVVTCLNCSEGHIGPLCDQCEPFYYGEPQLPDGYCSPCECNGNSDTCDGTTGQCVNCLSDTTGFNCEKCIDGKFGNASLQNCQDCSCDPTGSTGTLCDHMTGQCPCKPGVNGRQCDACLENYYGFSSGTGCLECGCNPYGSISLQCQDDGICSCQTGNALGNKCDQCPPGKWGLPYRACEMCNCDITGTEGPDITQCELVTGQCDCKTGVGGRQCGECLPTWVDFSINGCSECNQCTKTLYDAVTLLQTNWESYNDLASWVSALQDRDRELQVLLVIMNSSITELRDSQQTFVELREIVSGLDPSYHSATVAALNARMTARENSIDTLLASSVIQMDRMVAIRTAAEDAYNAVNDASINAVQYVEVFTKWNQSSSEMLAAIQTLGGGVDGISFETEVLAIQTELARCVNVSVDADAFMQTMIVQAQETNRLESLVTLADVQFTSMATIIDDTNRILATATVSLSDAITILNETRELVIDSQAIVQEVETSLDNIDIILSTSSGNIIEAGAAFADTLQIKYGADGPAPVDASVDQLGFTGWSSALAAVRSKNNDVLASQPAATVFLTAAENQASLLYNISRDTISEFQTAQTHGQPAVDAIASYEEAISTLNEATEKALEANTTIAEALNYIQAFSVDAIRQEATISQVLSHELKTFVESRNVEPSSLSLRLTEANGTLSMAEQTWEDLQDEYTALQNEATALQQTAADPGINPSVTTATTTATTAINSANQVISASTTLDTLVVTNQQQVAIVQQSVANASILNTELQTLVPSITTELEDVISTVEQIESVQNQTTYQRSDINSRLAILQEKLARVQQAVANSKQPVHFSARSSMQFTRQGAEESFLFNRVSVNVKAETRNGLLFFTEDYPQNTLMAVEVVNGHPIMRFNLGQDLVSVESPVDICCDEWYEVIATRYSYEGRLSVKDMTTGGASEDYARSVVTYERYLKLATSSMLYVGGLPVDYQLNLTKDASPDLDESALIETNPVLNRDFVGCLSNVEFDVQELNLWQPEIQEGSTSCCNRPTLTFVPETPPIPEVSFNGDGYLVMPQEEFDVHTEAMMSVEFRSSMMNAILVLASRQDLLAYIGLYLSDKKVVFEYRTSGNLKQTLVTANDYADAQWYQVTGGFNSSHAVLDIRSGDGSQEVLESYIVPLFVSNINFPNLRSSTKVTIGSGIPNTNLERGPTNLKFAGCMRNLMLSSGTSSQPVARPMTNVTASEFAGVAFDGCLADVGPGIGFETDDSQYPYARLNVPLELRSTQRVEFQFKTMEPHGILAYSYDAVSFNKLFYITLYHGNVFVQYNIGEGLSDPLQTRDLYLNNGQWHNVRVEFNGLAATLKVDNYPVIASNRQLNTPGILITGANSYLYLGGVFGNIPTLIGGEFPVRESLQGDFYGFTLNADDSNSGEIDFNDPAIVISDFGLILSGVTPEVTQLPPLPYVTPPPPTGTPLPTTCANPVLPVYNSDVPRFGNRGDSYISFTLDDNMKSYFKNSFVLEVEFRAVSPNGIMLYAASSPQNPVQWMALSMEDGYLVFNIIASTRSLTGLNVRTKQKYNTGEWKLVTILRIGEFVAIMVTDNTDYQNNQQDSSIMSDLDLETSLFIGGVNGEITDPFPLVSKEGFDGCIRSVEISTDGQTNDINLDLGHYDASDNVEQCYENKVIQGISMQGSGWMLLENNFVVGNSIKIVIRLRTTVRNVLLLAVAQDVNNFFTLDISDGKVRAVVSHGSLSPYIARTQQVTSEYIICNGQSHEIYVSMTTNSLEIRMDSYPSDIIAFEAGAPVVSTNSPLYIGGIPDSEITKIVNGINTGSFTGCIESVEINDDVKDLRNPVSSVNIDSGCPLPM